MAQENFILTESQVAALEKAKEENRPTVKSRLSIQVIWVPRTRIMLEILKE